MQLGDRYGLQRTTTFEDKYSLRILAIYVYLGVPLTENQRELMASVLTLHHPIWVRLVVVEYSLFLKRETDGIFHV